MRLHSVLPIAASLAGFLACQHMNVEIGKPEDWPSPDPREPGCLANDAVKSYLNDLNHEMLDNWDLPRRYQGTDSVRIGFILSAGGKIARLAVFDATDQRIARSALRALRRTAPVPPLTGPESCLIGATIEGTFGTYPEGAEMAHSKQVEEPHPEEAEEPHPEEVGEAISIRVDRSPSSQPSQDPIAPLESGTEARPISRQNPVYPTDELERGIEGWVELDFVIQTDGTVGDPVVKDSGGGEQFERAVLESLDGWIFEPATLNGEPIEQRHARALLTFEMIGENGRKLVASDDFWNAHDDALEILKEERFGEARVIIDELATRDDWNLHENAMLWLLRAKLQEGMGDATDQLKSLKRAAVSDGNYLESDVYIGTLLQILALQVENDQYGDALETYEKLEALIPDLSALAATASTHDNAEKADRIASLLLIMIAQALNEQNRDAQETSEALTSNMSSLAVEIRTHDIAKEVNRLGAQLRALNDGKQPLVIGGGIGEDDEHAGEDLWRHTLLRKTAGIEATEGSLDHFEIRCKRRRVRAKAEPGVAVQLPEGWGRCEIYVFGQRGSTFQLVQYPNSPTEPKSTSGVEARVGDS